MTDNEALTKSVAKGRTDLSSRRDTSAKADQRAYYWVYKGDLQPSVCLCEVHVEVWVPFDNPAERLLKKYKHVLEERYGRVKEGTCRIRQKREERESVH